MLEAGKGIWALPKEPSLGQGAWVRDDEEPIKSGEQVPYVLWEVRGIDFDSQYYQK